LPSPVTGVLVPLAKTLLPDVVQNLPSTLGGMAPALSSVVAAAPAVMAADKLISGVPTPLLAVAPMAALIGPKSLAKAAGAIVDVASGFVSGVGNILGGGGYTPEELAQNARIQTALITAGEDPRNAIAKPAASPFKSVVTF
jgi:hypothetical protein